MRRFIRKPHPLFESTPQDPLDTFFDFSAGTGDGDVGNKDDKTDGDANAKKAAGAAGDTTFNFPNEDWVPQAIRGKSAKEAAEIMKNRDAEFTRVNTAYAEATKFIDTVKGGGDKGGGASKPADPNAGMLELVDMSVNAVLGMRLDKLITENPDVGPYRKEMVDLLSTIKDPRVRMTDDAMALVANQIRGNHYKEILDAAIKKAKGEASGVTPPVTAEGTAAGGTLPRPVGLDLSKINKERQANLASWYEGDVEAAKNNLLPAKE